MTDKILKWVKATPDNLPLDNRNINGLLKGVPALVRNSRLVKGYVTVNGNLEHIEDVEILAEVQTESMWNDEDMENAYNECGAEMLSMLLKEAQFKQKGIEYSIQDITGRSAKQWLSDYKQQGTNAQDHGLCKRCEKREAVKDYNGHEHWVCGPCYEMLSDEFDEEYD